MRRKNAGDAEDRGPNCDRKYASAAGLVAHRRAPIPSNWQSTVASETGKTLNTSGISNQESAISNQRSAIRNLGLIIPLSETLGR